jgi:hypothetical protein
LKKGSKSHPILSPVKQPLQGIYLKENWKKRQPMAVYHCDVGQAMSLVG